MEQEQKHKGGKPRLHKEEALTGLHMKERPSTIAVIERMAEATNGLHTRSSLMRLWHRQKIEAWLRWKGEM